MPVKHNLYADLGVTAEAFEAHKKKDSRLSTLEEDYLRKDRQVVEAEENASADEEINRLRKERLKIKDEITAHLRKT
ncbi:YdcH family protein [Pseudomonas japonica]|uniref:YdcH family protein n=1 Tax=Pseudomonas TaxID=286 RepID=UPI00292801ED|nr:YdcH family protein [Pseudomonas sp. zfem002]MDU9391424.1 YdcH family protein [Pseudomonas sp. zfem002]